MVPGFNTNFSWRDQTYYIQTEPGQGRSSYSYGHVPEGRGGHDQAPYGELLGPDPSPRAVQAPMASQHRQVIAEIRAGKVEGEAAH